MRWTAEHWAKLDKDERSVLMGLLKDLNSPAYRDPFMPDDVRCCPGCGEPTQLCGCYVLLTLLTHKMGVPRPDI